MFTLALVQLEIDLRNERHDILEILDLGMVAAEEEMEEMRQDNISLERVLGMTKDLKERWVGHTMEAWQQVGTKQQEIETLKKEIAKCQEQHCGVGDFTNAIEDIAGWEQDFGMERKLVQFRGRCMVVRRLPKDRVEQIERETILW